MSEPTNTRRQERRRRRLARRSRRRIAASGTMNRILWMTLGPWLSRLYNLHAENIEAVRRLRPPFLVLPNHGSVWDPFMVNWFVPGAIHYVVSDANFRSRLVEFGLGLVGSIPKTKVMSDLQTVKNIMKVKERGGVVGIFPEGQACWDGHTLPLTYSTAKLAKLLRIPVVTARLAGAFLSKPRWSRTVRRGRVTIRYDVAFTPEELKAASVEEIDAKIAELLTHDEFEYNRNRRVRFLGRNRAEYAEIALFACPECRRFSTLRSERNDLACTACGYRVRFSIYGLFRKRSKRLHFDTMRAWNVWQIRELHRRLADYVHETDPQPLFREERVRVQIGYKSMPLTDYRTGRIELFPDSMLLTPEQGAPERFPLSRIDGINVQNNEHLEFYFGDDLYRITILDPRGCTYKWDAAVRRLKELAAGNGADESSEEAGLEPVAEGV